MQCECVSAKWIKWAMGNYIGGLKDASALIGSHFPSMKCFFFLLPLLSLSHTKCIEKYLQKEIVSLLGKTPAVLDFGNALYLIHKMLLLMPFLLHCPSAVVWRILWWSISMEIFANIETEMPAFVLKSFYASLAVEYSLIEQWKYFWGFFIQKNHHELRKYCVNLWT